MNKILVKISQKMKDSVKEYLPKISNVDLEEDGKIYYMNGSDGTLFDYYMNNHLCPFMIFYNDEENMGAIKLTLYVDGKVDIYIYENHEDKPFKEISTLVNASQSEILELAVIMNKIADDKKRWDYSIEDMDSNIKITESEIKSFISHEEDYQILNELFKTCIITNKIMDEDWKVGSMQKLEPNSETDSGWFLSAGNESQKYVDDSKNLCRVMLNELCDRDPVLVPYLLDKNVGDCLIRVSDDEFEMDDGEKEIFTSKFE